MFCVRPKRRAVHEWTTLESVSSLPRAHNITLLLYCTSKPACRSIGLEGRNVTDSRQTEPISKRSPNSTCRCHRTLILLLLSRWRVHRTVTTIVNIIILISTSLKVSETAISIDPRCVRLVSSSPCRHEFYKRNHYASVYTKNMKSWNILSRQRRDFFVHAHRSLQQALLQYLSSPPQ